MKIIIQNKKLFISYFCLCFAFFFVNTLFINITYNNYKKIVNNKIVSIINLKNSSNYEEDILNSLNNNFLDKYGFDKKDSYIKVLNREMHQNLLLSNLLIFLFTFGGFIIIYKYIKKCQRNINEVINYIENILNNNYILDIKTNEENDMSRLKNELYKVTVCLKESADASKAAKENLKISIEDISHQIKTPLTSISILLENIMDNPKMNNQTRLDFINEINKQTEIIKFLSLSLLKLAKFDAGVIKFNKHKIRILDFINSIKLKLEHLLKEKNIKINILNTEDIFFFGDLKWEQEAFTNIIKNCLEASKKDGIININYIENSLYTKIIIEDFGKGISKKDLNHIFERFYKVKDNSKDSYGIGLNLAKNIIEKDNGYITVTSTVNVGTKFTVKFFK